MSGGVARGMTVGLAAVLTMLLLTALPFVHPAPARADDAIAKALFESGEDAMGRRRYDEAVRFFRRALDESSELIEAAYAEAQAHEKLQRTTDALRAYRTYLSLFREKAALGEVSRSEESMAKRAAARVEKLAAGERAFAELQDAFVTQLLAFADNHAESDPAVARDAVQHVLSIDPGNPDARERFEELGGAADDGAGRPEAAVPAGPFERLKKGPWHDLITRKSLGTSGATYEGGSMFVDAPGGKIMSPTERIKTGERYVVDMSFRVLEEHEPSWLVGIVVGWEGEEFYSAFVQRGQIVLNRGHAKQGPLEDVQQHPMRPIDPRRWHRLSVRIEGRAMVVWFDDDVVCRTEVDDPAALQGEIGLFHQRCKAEYRLLQAAELE